MENQHKLITGYRDLSQAEIDLMNDIKAVGVTLEALVHLVDSHIRAQHFGAQELKANSGDSMQVIRLEIAQPGRWLAIARTDFQTGLMALVRAVAQPGSF